MPAAPVLLGRISGLTLTDSSYQLPLDYEFMGLVPGQVPELIPVAVARRATGTPVAVNLVVTRDDGYPERAAKLEAIPPPEAGGEIDVEVVILYGSTFVGEP